ncbi:hypothetical protein TNCV_3699391 [Trichonephila clavipes]|uniref:Uncharacterized protein n=1 Tax=Trichonephila clavipes TaxID=2585209 RepID=A0A8X6SN68_TRICX|nr:hypothetical protein TNCV_3699391 [Trichonephila clavipes]
MDYELERLEEKTNELSKVDEEIHNLLPDEEYEQDVVECEKYEDNAKLTIFLAKKKIREGSEQSFPDEIAKKWIIHAERESEGNITKLMDFLSKEVEGALTALKIKGDTVMVSLPPTTAFYVNTKRTSGQKKNNHTPFGGFYESITFAFKS